MKFLDRIRQRYDLLARTSPRRKSPLTDLYPDLAFRQHVYSSSARFAAAEADSYVGAANIYKVYVWVRKAIMLYANNIAPLPVRVVDSNGKALPSHPLSLLYSAPNPTMPAPRYWAILITHMLLAGERFAEIVDDERTRPSELWPRRPDKVQIAPDVSHPGYPMVAGYHLDDLTEELADVPAEAVIHEKFVNPLSDWRGLGPITAVLAGIKLDLFAQDQSSTFYQNQARPDYAIETKQALIPDERKRLEIQIDEKYGLGGSRAGKPIILEPGQMIHPLSFPQKDVEGLAVREVSRDEVAGIFSVPDILMGFGNDSYDTEEKREAAMSTFWLLALLPMIHQRDQTETHFWTKVRPMLRPGERVETDLSSVSEVQERLGPKLESASRLWSFGVPFNAIDKLLRLGVGPIPGGDVGYLPAGLSPAVQEQPSGDGEGKSASEGASPPILGYHIDSGVVSRNEARAQLGLPPEDETQDKQLRRLQSLLTVAQLAVITGIDVASALALVGLDPSLADDGGTPPPGQARALPSVQKRRAPSPARIAAALRRQRLALARKMEKDVDSYFDELADLVAERARESEKGWTVNGRRLSHVEYTNGDGKREIAPIVKLPTVADLLLQSDETRLAKLFREYTIEILSASWETWNLALDLDVAFEQSDPAVVAALEQSATRVKDITDTTRDAIRQILQHGKEEGWTIDQLINGVGEDAGLKDVVSETYKGRSRTIARTELGTAQQSCAVARYRAADVKRVLVLDNGQDDPDDACAKVNGTTQTLDWAEKNPLEHPNCTRCFAPQLDD